MEGTYDILLGGAAIGQVQVIEQGLYWQFQCRCRLSGTVFYQITVTSEGQTVKLGIPVPECGWFVLNTRIPKKQLKNGPFCFHAVPRHSELKGFIPVKPEEPFAYLARIKDAYLAVRNGQVGIVLRDVKESGPGT